MSPTSSTELSLPVAAVLNTLGHPYPIRMEIRGTQNDLETPCANYLGYQVISCTTHGACDSGGPMVVASRALQQIT